MLPFCQIFWRLLYNFLYISLYHYPCNIILLYLQ
nr:MAG TPA: hypothetical protein [Caudoviricetes sp.]